MDLELSSLLEDDPQQSAALAGLRYVSDEAPGFRRLRWGRGFTFRDHLGKTVTSATHRARFASLVIPPAWKDVWICRHANGHIQATGRDEAGRKQYLYHPRWREVRDRAKYDRVVAFGKLLPKIRARVKKDIASGDELTRERVLATVVKLLETTLVRVGNDEYAKNNGSYGLTTIRSKHVTRSDDQVVLDFAGKSGKDWNVTVEDPALIDVILECLETPGYEVFKYFDHAGVKRDVTSDDVNAYLREISGAHVTAKDFRTFAGTVLAAVALEELERVEPDARYEKRLVRAIERVAEQLGNTPSVCRGCYVHPAVLEHLEEGVSAVAAAVRQRAKSLRDVDALRPEEAAVLEYLEAGMNARLAEAS